MTPDKLREVKIDRCVNCGYLQAEHSPKDGACPCYDMMESYFHPTYKWKVSGKPDSEMDERDNRIAELEAAHAAALEEIERLNAAWKAQQFHLEAEERESAHWQERAEQAERRAERLKVHAEAMAESLESEIKARYAGLTDYPSMRRKYQQDMEEVEAYRAAYPKE